MNHELIIESIKRLLTKSSDVTFDNLAINASIILENQDDVEFIKSYYNGEDVAIDENGATFRVKENASIVLNAKINYLLTPRKTDYHSASYQSFLATCLGDESINVSNLFVYEDWYYNIRSNDVLKLPYLIEIMEFIRHLQKQYYNTSQQKIVMFAKSYCEISLEAKEYSKYLKVVDLFNTDTEAYAYFDKLIKWLSSNSSSDDDNIKKSLLVHENERFTILASEIYDLVIDTEAKERIFKVLNSSETLYKSVMQKYALYLDDFKYSKFNEKLTKFANDFLEKVNKNISDLQTQVLAIPMASALLATFKPDSKLLWVTFLAFLIYSLMVLYTTFQQSFNLLTLENQIKDFKKTYVKENDELKEKWNKETHPIFKKICWHKWYMRFVLGFILIVCGVCIYNLANMDESLFIIYLIQELSHNLFNITA